ncbi:MAG: CvpA family protein [Planctomycetota bacterium]
MAFRVVTPAGWHDARMCATIATPDVVVALLCGILAVRGAMKGFAWQAVRTVGLIAAVVAAGAGYRPLAGWIEQKMSFVPDVAAPIVAWFALFVGVLLVATWFAWMARGAVRTIKLGFADRIAGFLMGAIMGLVLLTIAFLAIGTYLPDAQLRDAMEGSISVRAMAEVAHVAEPVIPEKIQRHWQDALRTLQDMAGKDAGEPTPAAP